MEVKQVLVVRNTYLNENNTTFSLRKGKIGAQCAHAGRQFLLDKWGEKLNDVEIRWLESGHVTVVLRVDSEEELLAIHQKAKDAGLYSVIITDLGYTEFHGQPTKTVVGIGPDLVERIDAITGSLKPL